MRSDFAQRVAYKTASTHIYYPNPLPIHPGSLFTQFKQKSAPQNDCPLLPLINRSYLIITSFGMAAFGRKQNTDHITAP